MSHDGAFTQIEVEASVRRVGRTLLELIHKTGPMNLITMGDLAIHPAMQVQFNARFIGEPDRTVAEVMIAHALESERMGPGSFTSCLQTITKGVRTPRMMWQADDITGARELVSCPPTIADVDRIIEQFSTSIDVRTREMLKTAVTAVGFGGRIIVERSQGNRASLEHVVGYTFSLVPAIDVSSLRLVRPRIICIDGIVEEVAEIHHLLEAASEAKEPVVLFIRGLSEDVRHTLKVNYDRGSLCVIPITVRFDFEGINTLADISTITGSEVTSAARGDLISGVKFVEAPRVDSVRTGPTGTVLSNSRTRAAVDVHVKRLRMKRAEQDEESVAKLYDERLRSLSARHVIVRLPDDKDYVVRSQAIDRTLRAIRSLVERGITSNGDLLSTDVAVRTYSSRCVNVLRDLGAVLVRS